MQLFQQLNIYMFAIWPKYSEYVWTSDGSNAILADQQVIFIKWSLVANFRYTNFWVAGEE